MHGEGGNGERRGWEEDAWGVRERGEERVGRGCMGREGTGRGEGGKRMHGEGGNGERRGWEEDAWGVRERGERPEGRKREEYENSVHTCAALNAVNDCC